jgi:hypothetical protein
MRPIKLYWSRALKQGRPNFGDALSPLICATVSNRAIVHASPEQCDLMAIGSILQKAPRFFFWKRRIHVWGSGLIEGGRSLLASHRYHAVRGVRTASTIRSDKVSPALGDPGLLADLIAPALPKQKHYRIGVIPHYRDQSDPIVNDFVKRTDCSTVIDILSEPIPFLRRLAECEVVLSSSLHGLVAADSLGIPNAWIVLSDKVRGKNFKFHDYYSAFGLDDVSPFPFAADTDAKDVERVAESYQRPGLAGIKDRLIKAFPSV